MSSSASTDEHQHDTTQSQQPLSTSPPSRPASSSSGRAPGAGAAQHTHSRGLASVHGTATTTIFMGEGTPRQTLLRSPRSDSPFSSPELPSLNASLLQQQAAAFLPSRPPTVHPITSLELRVRWLEALVAGMGGVDPHSAGHHHSKSRAEGLKEKEKEENMRNFGLLRKVDQVQRQLDQVVEENDQLRRFMTKFDEYEHILNPAFALSPTSTSNASTSNGQGAPAPSYEELNDSELDALIKDMEPDLRAADLDLREISALDKRGVTGAGRLPEHEALKSRLQAVIAANQQDNLAYKAIEERLAVLLQRYSSHVTALSELFVHWNDSVTDAEDYVARLEQKDRERARTAFE